jgi:hypothetical protein
MKKTTSVKAAWNQSGEIQKTLYGQQEKKKVDANWQRRRVWLEIGINN